MATTSAMRVLVRRLPLPQSSSTTIFSRENHVRHLSLYRGSYGTSRLHQCQSWGKSISGCPSTASPAPIWKHLRIKSVFRGLRIGVTRPRPSMAGKDKSASAGSWTLRRLSSHSQGGGSGNTTLVYGLVGLNILGTLVWLVDSDGPLKRYMVQNMMVSTYSTLGLWNLHTLFTTNFSHSNIWNGAICSYMVYNVGSMAVQYLGRAQFLALYLLGGTFSQLCQVAGPIVAHNLPVPSILEVHPRYYTDGGFGATLSLLAWYCFMFPSSQVVLVVVPIQTGVAGALYLGATLYTVVTNGDSVPFLGGPPHEVWRTLGAVAAGGLFAFVTRGRGRYQFMQRF